MDVTGSDLFSNVPFSIFHKDVKQYSLSEIRDEDNRTFMWHQFMLDVLRSIPRSSVDNENVIAGARRINDIHIDDPITLKETDINEFQATYTPNQALNWYTRDSFLYRAFNKACRTLNSDAIIQFHSIVKDLSIQLKELCLQQEDDWKCLSSITLYRGQATWGIGEAEKLRASKPGDLIAMNTFLSTSFDRQAAVSFLLDGNKDTSILFHITVNIDDIDDNQFPIFADIRQYSRMEGELEVLFGMSSVFQVISVEENDSYWVINLELTNVNEDEELQNLMNEVKTYIYQISGKRLPFIVFKELFTVTTDRYLLPFTELLKFVLADLSRLFIINAYKKEGRMKELIDADDDLHALMEQTNGSVIRSSDIFVCLLFDMLDKFVYFQSKHDKATITFDMTERIPLLVFGGFLLMIGEYDKSIQYFKMLSENESIDERFKEFIKVILGVCYANIQEEVLASEYLPVALQLLHSSSPTIVPSGFAGLIASAHSTLYGLDQQTNQVLNILKPFMNKKPIDNAMNEKLRLVFLGHICFEQQKFVDALNHWEEALEIKPYLPASVGKLFNGCIYLQIAAAYFRLNNKFEALNVIERSIEEMGRYYPLTHRIFAGLNLMYGFYLILNEKPCKGLEYLEKAVTNSYFLTNKDFLGTGYSLMTLGALQSGDIDRTEQYGKKALEYQSANNISILVPSLLEELPQFRLCVGSLGPNYARQLIAMSMQLGQQMLSSITPNLNMLPDITNAQIYTSDELITYADHYRHCQDYRCAEIYYRKALESMMETDENSIWVVYKKMMRMNQDGNDLYRDYFIEQSFKYDENNPAHYSMIVILQVILYRFCLDHDELELGFDCLIYGTTTAIKFFYHRLRTNVDYIWDFLNDAFHFDQLADTLSILTKSMLIYSSDLAECLQKFLLTNCASDDLYMNITKIIYHPQIDKFLDQMKLKYNDDQSSTSIFLFLDMLLLFLRQSMTLSETSTLSFLDQLLELMRNYNEKLSPMFYLMKTLESLLIDDIDSFSLNLDKFRVNTITFERYNEVKEKISEIFKKLDENQLFIYLENIAKNL